MSNEDDSDLAEWDANFDESWERRMYEERGNSPEVWDRSAAKLLAAVELLAKEVDPAHDELLRHSIKHGGAALPLMRDQRVQAVPVLVMLRAMAVECLLKAMWVEKNGRGVNDGNLVTELKSHNLVALCEKVGIELTTEELSMLRRLRLWLTVHGRYPIGTSWDADRAVRKATGAVGPISSWGPADSQLCDKFILQLRTFRAPRE